MEVHLSTPSRRVDPQRGSVQFSMIKFPLCLLCKSFPRRPSFRDAARSIFAGSQRWSYAKKHRSILATSTFVHPAQIILQNKKLPLERKVYPSPHDLIIVVVHFICFREKFSRKWINFFWGNFQINKLISLGKNFPENGSVLLGNNLGNHL